MDEQRRLLLALGLIALVVVGMTYLWPTSGQQAPQVDTSGDGQAAEPESEPAESEEPEPAGGGEDGGDGQESAEPEPAREMFPEKRLTLRTPEVIAEINTRGGGLVRAELQNEQFREGRGDDVEQIDLVSVPVIERPELTPMTFQLVTENATVPAHTKTAEGQGVIRMLNHGDVTSAWLKAGAEIGDETAQRLIAKRPYATIEAVERAISGSEGAKRATLVKLLRRAWRDGFVRLDFEVLDHDEEERAVLRGRTAEGIEVRRTIDVVSEHELRIRDVLTNRSSERLSVHEMMMTTGLEKNVSSGGCYGRPIGQLAGLCLHGEDMVRATRSELAGESSGCAMGLSCGGSSGAQSRTGQIRFVSVDRHYFMSAISPSDSWGETTCNLSAGPGGEVVVNLEPRVFTELPPSESTTFVSTMYLGPKEVGLLKQIAPGRHLWEAIDYGWFAPLSQFLLQVLRYFHGHLGNWGLAIILLTFIIKLLLLPVTHKTFKNMRKMQAEMSVLKPQLDEINERYKDKPDIKQQKTLELYNKNGINPLKQVSGCLPMFLQMPIWIALYRMISESVELYRAPFVLWLDDLSAQDPYYILPGLLALSMFVQQAITPSPGMDSQQQKMMKWMMPGMFALIMLNMPSGLVLYIFVNTLLTIIQQQFINRSVPASGPMVKPPSSKDSDESQESSSTPKRSKGKARTKRRKRK